MEEIHLGADDKLAFTRFLKGTVVRGFAFLVVLSLAVFLLTFYYRSVPEVSLVAFGAMATSIVVGLVAYGRTMLKVG
ncbi:MAG: hypothetical protein ABI377_07920 [Devosia sp.]